MLYFITIYIIIYTLTTSKHRMAFAGCTDLYCTMEGTEDPKPSSCHNLRTQKDNHPELKMNLSLPICHNYMPVQYHCLSSSYTRAAFGPVPPSIVPLFLFKCNLPFLQTSELLTALLEWRTESLCVSSVKGLNYFWTQEKASKPQTPVWPKERHLTAVPKTRCWQPVFVYE